MTLSLLFLSNFTKEYLYRSQDPVNWGKPKFVLGSRLTQTPNNRKLLISSSPYSPSPLRLNELVEQPFYVSIDIKCLYPFPIRTEFVVDPVYPFTKETVFTQKEQNPDLLIFALALAHVNPFVGSILFFAALYVPFAFGKAVTYEFIPRPFICGSRFRPTVDPHLGVIVESPETQSKEINLPVQMALTSPSPCSSADVMSLKCIEEVTPGTNTSSPDNIFPDSQSLKFVGEIKDCTLYSSITLPKLDRFSVDKTIDFMSCGIQTQKMIRAEAFNISSSLLQSCCAIEFLKGILEDPLFANDLDIDEVASTSVRMDWSQAKSQVNSKDEFPAPIELRIEETSFDWYEDLRIEEENIGIGESPTNHPIKETEVDSLAFVTWVAERFPKMANHVPVPLPTPDEEVNTSRYINVHFNNNYDVINLNSRQDNAVYRQILSFDTDTPPAEFSLHSYDKRKIPRKGILKRSATTQDIYSAYGSDAVFVNAEEFKISFSCDFNSLKSILQNVARTDIRSAVKAFGDLFEKLISTANFARLSFLRLALDAQKHFAEIYHVTLGIVNELEVVTLSNDSSTNRVKHILGVLCECRERLLNAQRKSEHLKDCVPGILTSFILQRKEILSQRKTLLPIYYRFVNECSRKYHIKTESFHKSSGKKSFEEGCKYLVGISISNLEDSLYNDIAQLETAGVLVEYMSTSLEERLLELRGGCL